jgi:hypothetical protein
LQEDYFGGMGSLNKFSTVKQAPRASGTKASGVDKCLAGPFAQIKYNNECIERDPLETCTLYHPHLIVTGLASCKTFVELDNFIQYGPHAAVHNFFRGNMYQIATSPSDPIFWLHHATMDYYFTRKQGMENNKYYTMLDGNGLTPATMIMGKSAEHILDYYGNLCYSYEDPVNAPLNKHPLMDMFSKQNPNEIIVKPISPPETPTRSNSTSESITKTIPGSPNATPTVFDPNGNSGMPADLPNGNRLPNKSGIGPLPSSIGRFIPPNFGLGDKIDPPTAISLEVMDNFKLPKSSVEASFSATAEMIKQIAVRFINDRKEGKEFKLPSLSDLGKNKPKAGQNGLPPATTEKELDVVAGNFFSGSSVLHPSVMFALMALVAYFM